MILAGRSARKRTSDGGCLLVAASSPGGELSGPGGARGSRCAGELILSLWRSKPSSARDLRPPKRARGSKCRYRERPPVDPHPATPPPRWTGAIERVDLSRLSPGAVSISYQPSHPPRNWSRAPAPSSRNRRTAGRDGLAVRRFHAAAGGRLAAWPGARAPIGTAAERLGSRRWIGLPDAARTTGRMAAPSEKRSDTDLLSQQNDRFPSPDCPDRWMPAFARRRLRSPPPRSHQNGVIPHRLEWSLLPLAA
jgi:hypothetical protein